MKKIVKVLSFLVTPLIFIGAFLAGCKSGKAVEVESGDIMQDIDVKPTQTPAYEKWSRQAIEDYKAVARRHVDGEGETDYDNKEVIDAARAAAAKLYAYACYNERTLDRYAWFNNQTGGTDLGGGNFANIVKQDYYLRVNESEDTCGYRFTYTYKWATEYAGTLSPFKSVFEAARMAVITDTDVIYKFEGDTGTFRFGEPNDSLNCNMVECDWSTKSKEWGVKDYEMVKDDFIPPEDLEADIIKQADEYWENGTSPTIHGNINILAEDIVKYAMIIEDPETGRYLIMMNIDTEVANKDDASLKMLRKINSPSNDCAWKSGENGPDDINLGEDTGLKIIFSIWDNGLFYHYTISERWNGTIVVFNGTAESAITVYYSYSDRDCDMTKNLEMLEHAKKTMNTEEE